MRKIFMVAALYTSSQLSAQTTDTASGKMDEVTLTASKYSVKTTETGKVVTVITREQIDHAGSRDLSQVITELGGVFINGFNSNAGKEKNIYLRGARVDYTLITIDGVPVYDASGIGSNFDIRNIPVDNVERIEILKGSQSTLYGSDAIAGVINIITRKSGAKPFQISGTAHYGSFQTLRVNTAISGQVKALDYQAGYTHFRTDGYSEARRFNAFTVPFDKDGFRQHGVHASAGIQLSSHLRIQPFFRYNQNRASLDQDAFTDELDFTNEIKNTQAGIRNIISFGKSQVNVLYQYNHTDRFYLDDSTKSRNGFFTYHQATYLADEHFGEEVDRPRKTIPNGIFIGIVIIILLYLSVSYAYYNAIGFDELKNSEGIASIVAEKMFGRTGRTIASVLLFIAVLAYVNVLLLSNPRVMYAMSLDGILPKAFQKKEEKKDVLTVSLTVFAAMGIIVLFFAKTFSQILGFTIFLDSIGMASSAATIFILRKRTRHLDGTGIYKMRLYPLLPLIFIAAYVFVGISIAFDTPDLALIGTSVFAAFLLIYFIVTRIKTVNDVSSK